MFTNFFTVIMALGIILSMISALLITPCEHKFLKGCMFALIICGGLLVTASGYGMALALCPIL